MSYIYSTLANHEKDFELFASGYELGLTSLYNQLSRSIYRYGMMLVKDEFIVNSIIQEAFLKAWTFRERLTSLDHTRRFLSLESMKGEKWADIPGFDGAYSISNYGRIWAAPRLIISADGKQLYFTKERIRKQSPAKHYNSYTKDYVHQLWSFTRMVIT